MLNQTKIDAFEINYTMNILEANAADINKKGPLQ